MANPALNYTDESLLGQPITLNNCDREPIYLPGLVQPYGFLLCLDEQTRRVLRKLGLDDRAHYVERATMASQKIVPLDEVESVSAIRRRFVTPEHLVPLYRVMAPGAEFRVATDIPDYMRQTLEEVPRAGFALVAEGPAAWDDWHSTRYEQKALREGRVPHYATFRR